jgi:putative colanic acid biosysnthesis UDP-glucose lipid carrier transferase
MPHSSLLKPVVEHRDAPNTSTQAPVRMFATPNGRGLFRHAPQSTSGFVAALLEPALNAGVLVGAHWVHGEPFSRASMALLLLVLALTFPGVDRFHDRQLSAAVDIVASWVWLLALLLLCGYATRSLGYFEWPVLLTWALVAPILQWAIMMAGRDWLRWRARQPEAARRAIVVGAGALAIKLSRALQARHEVSTDVVGFFDDRRGDRIDPEA